MRNATYYCILFCIKPSVNKFMNFTDKVILTAQLAPTIGESLYWLKTRTAYTVNSWIYTTNHKRISINYFNFVLVAGTAGMSLATVIRLEFAYPGVGWS